MQRDGGDDVYLPESTLHEIMKPGTRLPAKYQAHHDQTQLLMPKEFPSPDKSFLLKEKGKFRLTLGELEQGSRNPQLVIALSSALLRQLLDHSLPTSQRSAPSLSAPRPR